MKIVTVFFISLFILSCKTEGKVNTKDLQYPATESIKNNINTALNLWHKAAAKANYNDYFNLMTSDAVFIGTDATENWQMEAFKTFSKPYFNKGKAWNFTAVDRNIYIYDNQKLAWFDELLDTQMKLCRGSGILKLEDNQWKVAHYVLSMVIPNENVGEVVKIKADFDSAYAKKLRLK